MKKHLLMLCLAVMAGIMSLNARTILIDEGFENGIQESEWTQEFVSGNMPWAVESVDDGLSWPSTVKQGSYRAYLRNNSAETQGYVTRLVSKVMDLHPMRVYMPELVFWYANPRWGGDRDTLRVLYRTGSREQWKQLAEYSTASANWQKVKLSLPEVNSTYQIAFEGSDNLGHGIVLDSIKLQSAPDCTVPHDLSVTNKGAGKVRIAWMASFDADYYELIVSKDTIDPDTVDNVLPSRIAYHGQVWDDTYQDLTLEAGEFYLAYVRSNCEDENSAWSSEASKDGPFGFQVRTSKQVPFTENFNYPSGVYQDPDWTWGCNTGKLNPFVNSKASATAKAYYSPDTTAAVIFSGGETSKPETLIPADHYVYLVTPAISDSTTENFRLNQCQVQFWSTVYTYTGRQYGRGIIVGVMTNPEDITTFVPVDTVTVWGNVTFQENIVDLSSYSGNGAYVAFVSNFDRDNVFYMDNLTISYRPEVNKVTKISVNPRDTYATISWEGNADSYNVLITNALVDPTNPNPAAVIDEATVSSNQYTCDVLEPNHSWNRPYYVYVQAEGTDWSYRYPFVTVASERAIPYKFDFESGTTTKYQIAGVTGQFAEGLGIFGNSGTYPAVQVNSNYSYADLGYLFMSKRGGADAWITLPMVESLEDVQVKFYLSGSNTPNQAHATIGIMTNPMDINTFVPVTHFTLNSTGYTRCYANFVNYDGPDGVIAIVWDDVMKMSQNTVNYIDEITVEELSDCVPPLNITLQVEPDSVTVGWDAGSWDQWEFFLSRSALSESDRIHKTLDEIKAMRGVVVADSLQWDDLSTTPQFGFGGLIPHATYYLYVRSTCDLEWWTEATFSTPCQDEAFPYKETFENYNAGATTIGCWQLADYMGIDYPTIYNVGTSSNSDKALEMYSSGTTHRSVAILPVVEGNLSDMLLTFDVRTYEGTASSSGIVLVGTMEDIEDANTFVPFDTIYVNGGSSFTKVRYILSNYELAYDHIALTSGLGTLVMNSHVLIDNVELKDPSCIEAYDFKQINQAPHSVDLTWKGTSPNDEWELKVLSSNASLSTVKNGTYNAAWDVIRDTLITGKNFHVEDLSAQRTYYIYVRTLCGDSTWAVVPVYTTCELLDPAKANKETFESYPAGQGNAPACWTVGTRTGTGTLPYINTVNSQKALYIYQSSGTAPHWAASPEIKCDSLESVIVSFSWSAYSGEVCVWGVMTDPTDLSTFVPLDSMAGTGTSTFYQKTVDLSDYSGIIPPTAKHMAWRARYNKGDWVYIDDISFVSNTCPMPKPSISDLTTNSVRVSSGLRTSDNWVLMVTNTAISDANLANEEYVVPESQLVYRDTIDRRSKEIFGLEPQTKYYVYTATLCDSVTMSQWSSISFMTLCQALTPENLGTITFDAKDGFETGSGNDLPCWTVGSKSQDATATYIPYVNNSSSYKHNGENYLQLYDNVTSSSSIVGAYAVMPALDVDSISKYQVNFWGRSNTSTSANNQVIVGVVTDPSDLNTFVAIDTLNLSKSTWDPYTVGFERYDGDYMGDYGTNIMFLSEFGTTNYAYISEISVELIPHCRPISSFSVDSVGENAAVVSWKGYQDTYRLLLSDKVLTDAQKPNYQYLLDTIVDHSEEILIENLLPITNYYVYAQGICDGGDSTAISIVYASIRTTCPTENGVPVPFYDNFESYELNDQQPGCWQLLCTGAHSSWFAVKEVSGNGTKAIDVESSSTNGCYVVVPRVDADLADLKLSFDARSWGGSTAVKMYVGVMADVNDVTTFVLLNTFSIPGQTTFKRCEMLLGEYDMPYDNLVITAGIPNVTPTTHDVYLDNVSLEREASCGTPRLKLIGTSYNTAELELTPAIKTDSLWEIVVVPDSVHALISNISQYLEKANTIQLDTTYVQLTDLKVATSYYVYARTICSATDKSAWSRSPLKFNTQFYYKDSYFFGFEKEGEQWDLSKYSASDNYYLHPALVTGKDSLGADIESYRYYPYSRQNTDSILYSRTGSGALVMHAYKQYHGGYIIFPAVDQAADRSFEFKIRPGDVKKVATSSTTVSLYPNTTEDGELEIGLVDKDRSFETYERIATIRLSKLDPKTTAKSKNNYLFKYYSLDLDSATIATKLVVLHMPKQAADSVNLFIDDVTLGAKKNFSLVALKKVTADGSSALVEWDNIGGPWKLTVKNAAGTLVAQFDNLTTTSQLVEGLDPQTDYTVTLEAVSVPTTAKNYVTSDQLAFRTLCQTLEPNSNGTDFVWDFDSDWEANDVLVGESSDSLYLKPSCFQVGITYDEPVNGYQWLIQRRGYEYFGPFSAYNASRHFEVGMDNSFALRVHTTETASNSYIVLPELNCGLDTMMLEFYGRCFANYDQTYGTSSYRGRIVDATYLGSAYSHSMVVGTLTDPKDFSTLQILDTLTYASTDLTTTDNVNNDPAGLRYWELMQLPLDNARGKYIVLFQPAPGLFFIDNLAVKPVGNTMFKPTNMEVTNISTTGATLSWNVRQPQFASVVVLLNAVGEEIFRDTVNATTYTLTGLDPSMRYEWYVYQTNATDDSPATKPQAFATECVVAASNYTCDFEPAEGWTVIAGQPQYTQTLCWTYSDALHNEWLSGTFDPYNQANTKDFKYSYSGQNAVMLRASYSARGTSYQPYIASPAMDVTTFDTLQVKFRIRPAYVSATNDSVISSYTGSTYSKSIIVGTMTDPTDAATFVAIDTVTYDGTLSTADVANEANEYLFQEAKVELAGASGQHVAFMTSFYEKGSTTQKTGDYLWLDAVSFEHRQECKEPTDLKVLQLGTYHAVLGWTGIDSAGSYLLQVSTDPFFAKEDMFIFNDFVESTTCTVKGMQPLTNYYWRVQAECGERWGESSFSTKASFKTSRSPYFLEEFTTTVNANDWTFSKAHADNVIDTTGTIARGVDNWSFSRTTNGYGLQGPHYAATGYSGDYHWMITPNFYLPEEDSVHFSMNLALTACNTAHLATANAVTENDMKDDYYFMIIVSDDGGATWKSENILAKWQNTNPAGHQLRDLSATGQIVRYSLAQYAGKNIRIGLYREAKTTSSTGIVVHVDNVRLAYFDKEVESASACQYEDVTIGDITLSGEDSKPGIHAYPTCFYVSDAEAKAGVRDSVFSMEIEVYPAQNLVIQDTICEGETYTGYDFLPKSETGIYRRKLQTLEHGCDSIVTLYLKVKERRYGEDTEASICVGEPYVWNGKTYNRAGIYRDTLVSSIGCDSIQTLVISYFASEDTIRDANRVELNELPFTYENPLHPYAAGQAPIYYANGTPKGTYVDTVLVQGENCSVVLIHTLDIYDAHEAIDNVDGTGESGARKVLYRDQMYIILQDEWYNAAGQRVADPRK